MSIYVTGDTHGSQKHGFFSVDGFMHRFNMDNFPEQKGMTKEDFVVILGDFGGVWDANLFRCEESPSEKNSLDWLGSRSFTTLFVPGNHENYDRLIGCKNEDLLKSWIFDRMAEEEKEKMRIGYPQKEWHGGKVRVIRPSVLMLERGYVFDLQGKNCFAFGGARSHDIQDGVLNPYEYPNEEEFKKDYQRRKDGFIRVNGVSWWPQEMPSREEMELGLKNIREAKKRGKKIDFVFTHDAPASDKIYLGYHDVDELNKYFEEVLEQVGNNPWFYGHMHENRRVFTNHWMLYEQVVQIA